MIAMALACDPDMLIADEPTTALDVTVQAQILDLLAELQTKLGMAIVFITHDLGIVQRFADRVYVMRAGEVVETGATAELFAAPQHPYTQMLLAAEPEGSKSPPPAGAPDLITGEDVRVTFELRAGVFSKPHVLHAVDGVSLRLREGRPSGSSASWARASRRWAGRCSGCCRARAASSTSAARSTPTRGRCGRCRRALQLVFQDPFGSLSPRMTVGRIITEGLLIHEPGLSSRDRDVRAGEALDEVGLDPTMRNRYPHEFSGGQRQRVAIARAMILKPHVIVLDEPTSALDRSVQKQIVELLRDLQAAHDLSYLFISHDLAVVRAVSDYILVMKGGRVVEEGPTEAIFDHPAQDYTRTLMAAALDTSRFRESERRSAGA